MSTQRKNSKKSAPPVTKNVVIPLWALLILLFSSIVILFYLYLQFKPTVETRHSQVRKIPPAISRSFPKPPLSQSIRVPILLYHYVEYVADKGDTIRQSLNIQPHTFEQQVKTLQEAHYTFMTASDLADVLDGKKDLPNKPVLLTFDDGHRDFATDVMPILEKYNVKVTQYVISGFLGGSDFMTPDQIKKVVQSRLVEIGAHTVHHISLSGKLLPVVQYEVTKNKSDLEKTYGIKVVSLAYPNGSFDEQAIEVVKRAGFKTAVSTVPGIDQSQNNRYFLYRLRPGYKIGEELLTYLEQSTFPIWKK